MSLTILQNEKTPFQALKTRRSKSRKIDIFPKGSTHGFGPEMAIFSTSFFQPIQSRKMCFTIFQNEKTPFQAIKKKFKNSKNCHYSKGVNPWFLYKNGHLSNFFLLGNIGQEKVFVFDILERKNAILGYKKRSSNTRKIAIILKELTHGFGTKIAVFPTSFCQAISARKRSLFSIFQNEKTPFQAIKKKVQKVEKLPFFQRG